MYDFASLQAWIEALYVNNGINDRLWIEPYDYPLSFAALAPGATQTQTIQINANADFVIAQLSYHANIAVGAQNVGNKTVAAARVQIVDTGSARPFFASAADLENVCANASPQRVRPYPRWTSGNTSLSVAMSNYSPAETYNIEFLVSGASVRGFSRPVSLVAPR